MKKLLSTIFIVIAAFLICSCTNKEGTIDETQVKNICELATVECYFNNLAMTDVSKGDGITHWFEKDRTLWLEYDGVVKLGIDMEKVSIKVSKNKVTVKLPHAKVLSKDFEYSSLKEPKIVKNKDSWINKNKITDEVQKEALTKAQEKMIETINGNKSMMNHAEDKAKLLIENYINNIGKISGKKYEITWKFID